MNRAVVLAVVVAGRVVIAVARLFDRLRAR